MTLENEVMTQTSGQTQQARRRVLCLRGQSARTRHPDTQRCQSGDRRQAQAQRGWVTPVTGHCPATTHYSTTTDKGERGCVTINTILNHSYKQLINLQGIKQPLRLPCLFKINTLLKSHYNLLQEKLHI